MHHAAGSKTSNLNNSANLKQNLKIVLDMTQGLRWILLMKKTRAVKYRTTGPLKGYNVTRLRMDKWIPSAKSE
jgi:hypothetical protein